MYKVVTAERTAKVEAPSMVGAAVQFLGIPLQRFNYATKIINPENPYTSYKSAMFNVCTEDRHETGERVAVFEIEEEDDEEKNN